MKNKMLVLYGESFGTIKYLADVILGRIQFNWSLIRNFPQCFFLYFNSCPFIHIFKTNYNFLSVLLFVKVSKFRVRRVEIGKQLISALKELSAVWAGADWSGGDFAMCAAVRLLGGWFCANHRAPVHIGMVQCACIKINSSRGTQRRQTCNGSDAKCFDSLRFTTLCLLNLNPDCSQFDHKIWCRELWKINTLLI